MLTPPLDHASLCGLIPHTGSMCLLERVVAWDESTICCEATSHRSNDNPLRHDDRLATVNGVEYAAQAMALHGALLSGGAARPGYLAALRGVAWQVERLDDIEAALTVRAERLGGDGNGFIYRFTIEEGKRTLLSGQATVFNRKEGQ